MVCLTNNIPRGSHLWTFEGTSNPKVKGKTKMSEQKTKSNAPWILGVVGFCLSIPQIFCSILCAAADASHPTGTDADGALAAYAMLPVITTFVCFILSFFGKSKASTATGVLMILCALADIAFCCMNISALGIAAGVCFFCAGISSICNTKKLKA